MILAGGLAVVAIAVARGLAWKSAFYTYLWGGLVFGGLWYALMVVIGGGYWMWKRTRTREKPTTPELPTDIRVGGTREAWSGAVRSSLLWVAFVALTALIQPRFGAGLAGFSLIALTCVPICAYWRLRLSNPRYVVRGPGRRRRLYVRRSLA